MTRRIRVATLFAAFIAASGVGAAPALAVDEINEDAVAAIAGNIVIEAPWAITKPKGLVAAFLKIHNKGEADTLVEAFSELAKNGVLAETNRKGGKTQAIKVDTVDLKKDTTVDLTPEGYHILLVGVDDKLKGGDTIPVTLVFDKAGEIEVQVSVAISDDS